MDLNFTFRMAYISAKNAACNTKISLKWKEIINMKKISWGENLRKTNRRKSNVIKSNEITSQQ